MPGLQRFLRDEVFFSVAAALVFFVVFLRTTPRGHATTLIFRDFFRLFLTLHNGTEPRAGVGKRKKNFFVH